MAQISPDGWRELAVTGAAKREIETLAILADSLPDEYTVYHAVHWTNVEQRYAIYGEIDFAVVNQAGDLLLIEQKSGFLSETPDGLVKQYPGKSKSVPVQISRMVSAIRGKLAARGDIPSVLTDALLYCPDYTVRQAETAGLAPERIVDAARRDQLCSVIQKLLPIRETTDATKRIHTFLRDLVQLEADVSALMGHARNLVTRISGGLSYWARQLEFDPYRLRVIGTAGSGKTQLALAEYRAAIDAGKRPLYICYNRPLADHFANIAPDGGIVATFFQFCDQRVRFSGETPDFKRPDAFEQLLQRAHELPIEDCFLFDTVIIDEGQDFSDAWRDFIFKHALPKARMLWLEDPMQNLYGKNSVPLDGWLTLHARSNYRSPRPIVHFLQSLLPTNLDIEARSPIEADEIEILTYQDTMGLYQSVKEAIRNCYSAGFKKKDIAIVSYHGREKSNLMHLDSLGQTTLRRFSGGYDLFGQPVFTDGEILLESVYRFKGQAAPAIIFTEIDFEMLDDKAIRKLFVGATRSMMKLILIIHERSAVKLLERLG